MRTPEASSFWTVALLCYAILLLAIGLALLGGGVWLLLLGGSIYYAIAALLVLTSAVLLWRRRRRGASLYAVMLVGSIGWALAEVGWEGWPLMPRILAPAVLGLPLLLPAMRRRLAGPPLISRRPWLILVLLALALGTGLHAGGTRPEDPLFRAGTVAQASSALPPATGEASGEWPNYGNDPGGSRFSPAAQIDPRNVARLEPAWTFRTGLAPPGYVSFQAVPLEIGDLLVFCTGYNDVIAVDSATGRLRWRFRAAANLADVAGLTCRGVAYHHAPGANGPCADRILTNTLDARLIALDLATGRPCAGFGRNGVVSLLAGMGEVTRGYYYVTSAPTIVRGKVVLGGWVTDGQYWGEPSGVVRAFDAVTGRLSWAFDMGRPGQTALPTAGASYTRGTPNSWAPMSADEALGLVYVPTGNATPDYYGAQRRPFDDHYSSSVVAIDALSGLPRWRFQTTHHDVWDYDVASQPTLVDIRSPQGVRPALVQPTKRGEIFVLDRRTGRPISAVTEQGAPSAGHAAGERLSPTQPFAVGLPGFSGPALSEAAMWGITPLDQLWCRIRFRQARYDGPLTPPGLTPNVQHPGYLGGIDWGGVAIDRDRQVMIVNSNRVANYNRLLTRAEANARRLHPRRKGSTEFVGGPVAQAGTPYGADIRPFLSTLGVPCQQPPYGMLAAVDLPTGKLIWSRTLGTARDSGPLGIGIGLPLPMGVPNIGGSLVTRGGITFIAATQDRFLRAFETASGRLLWQARLPAGGQSTPMTYIARDGRQMVVIAAGGAPAIAAKSGDYLIAFALPGATGGAGSK